MARATRIALDMALEASKTLKPALGIAWQYAKTEIVPPFTSNFFHGPIGKSLEESVSKAGDNFIAGIRNQIQEIEAEKLREIKRKEAAAKALVEKIKAEAKRKAEEAVKKAEALAKNVKAKAVQKVKSDVQKATKEVKQAITKKVEAVAKKKPIPGDKKNLTPKDKK